MKLKWKLLPLAFAAVGFVGCTNEIEGGQENVSEQNGSTTYMTVSINSETVTKAAGGEGTGTEVGNPNEYDVDDITVILFKNNGGNYEISSTSTLVGAGYATVSGTSEGSTSEHTREATVTVTVQDGSDSFDGKTYGVIAVTNVGSESLKTKIGTTITTGAALADYLQTAVYTGSGDNASKFIMSSHNPEAETVTLEAGATPENAPEVTVKVERLAAKVRLSQHSGIPGFLYTITEGDTPASDIAKVKLNNVAIVNQLTSGTYLLKRVSANTAKNPEEIPDDVASDDYLADEVWDNEGSSNYVIDPWTRLKTTDKVKNISSITSGETALTYANPFSGNSYDEMWTSFATNTKDLANVEANATTSLGYVQENTLSAMHSLQGYATGALFKATYVPKQMTAILSATEVGSKDYDGYDNNTPVTFYVFQGNIYDSYDAIWAEYCMAQLGNNYSSSKLKYDSFKSTSITTVSKDDFMKSALATGTDPFGYVAYLIEKAESAVDGSWSGNFVADDGFDKFCEDHPRGVVVGEEGTLVNGTAINVYTNGICYYPYWIRHGDNGKSTIPGVMEFSIVRNNIYDMTVTGIGGLGLSGIDVPDPEDPTESDNLLFTVNILVKDWIVRSNSGIIL